MHVAVKFVGRAEKKILPSRVRILVHLQQVVGKEILQHRPRHPLKVGAVTDVVPPHVREIPFVVTGVHPDGHPPLMHVAGAHAVLCLALGLGQCR